MHHLLGKNHFFTLTQTFVPRKNWVLGLGIGLAQTQTAPKTQTFLYPNPRPKNVYIQTQNPKIFRVKKSALT